MKNSPASTILPSEEWPILRKEMAKANLQRMWWLLITSTSLSILLALFNMVQMSNKAFVPWQVLDIGGSAVFLVLILLGKRHRLPSGLRWALSPAYFAFWLLLMDGYYFCTLLFYGETATYALGVVTPSILILLPPRIFLSLLIPNHVVFCSILLFTPLNKGLSNEQVYASLSNGTLGVLVAILGAWFLFAAKRENFRNERLITKRTLEARQAESHLRAILENIPFQAWLKDVHGRFLAVNGGFAEATGLPVEKIIGQLVRDFPPNSATQYLAEDAGIIASKEKAAFEQSIEEPRGLKWFEVFKSPVIDDHGHILGTAGLARDITERKNMENRLVEADRAKSDFLATMSHEIRTPMNSVLGYAHILNGMPLESSQREYVESIIASGQLLLSVINDILDFSKIEAGKIILQEEVVRVSDLVSRMERMFEPLAAHKELALHMSIADDVPPFFLGDFHRVEQLLVNLLSNAVKFTNRGSVEMRVSTNPPEARGAPWRFQFLVKDTGIGVTPEQVDSLFKPFSQVDTTASRQFGGTGLGLVIASRLCELMGGTIEVKSSPNAGSTFTATILALLPEENAPSEHISSPAVEESADNLAPVRVLVVEDNASNRRLIAAILKRWGIVPNVVESGIAAVEVLKKRAFDVIFMDVQMPVMDGLETTRLIRQWEAAHPERQKSHIVALTAFAMADDRTRCLEAGMDDYLSKPFNPALLKIILEKQIRITG